MSRLFLILHRKSLVLRVKLKVIIFTVCSVKHTRFKSFHDNQEHSQAGVISNEIRL